MATSHLDYDKAASILVDAARIGERKAAERWQVTERTIRNYKRRLETDEHLSAAFRKIAAFSTARAELEKSQAELDWRVKCHLAIGALLQSTTELAERAVEVAKKTDDPKAIRQLLEVTSKALERLVQGEITSEALGVSTSGNTSATVGAKGSSSEGEGPSEGASGEASTGQGSNS